MEGNKRTCGVNRRSKELPIKIRGVQGRRIARCGKMEE